MAVYGYFVFLASRLGVSGFFGLDSVCLFPFPLKFLFVFIVRI